MAGTAASLATATSKGPTVPSRRSKRKFKEVADNLLRTKFENLADQNDKIVPLANIRDAIMDHLLGNTKPDLRCTVLFICEEVVDFRLQQHATSAEEKVPLLEGINSDYQFYSRLSEGDSIPRCSAALLHLPISKCDIEKEKHAVKKAIKKRIKKFKKSSGETSKPSAEFYVLSPEELTIHLPSIPFDDAQAALEFVSTKPLLEGDNRSAAQLLLSLDCEMCRTTKGVELTRVTLIDADENILLDEYVRPKNPIVDYCTRYSGITCDIMETTTMRLDDIQKQFLTFVPAEAILIGHSIENDLKALRILHRRIIDTVSMYPHPKGPPFRSALRFLTSKFLNRSIQTGTDGHCSVEDAVATLQLAQLKIKHGPTFPTIKHEFKQKKVVNELARTKKSVLIVDSQRACRSLSGGVACIISHEDPNEVVQTVVNQLTTGFPPHLTWARIRGTNRSDILAFVRKIQANMPKDSCFVTVLGGDTNELRDLHKRRTARTDPRSSLMWDEQQQEALNASALAAQTGLVYICLQ
ncbi:small rna degrading nuclease 5-like [Plasmopara halstedii]|uniref:Small rna degrading nuclease 5-like n=1 Tax=Plasmopara halstedii TaxID=4781 RepID=A0A0P1B4C7_PLAHL|nr:small rna degrading nuclease 5-like [Plasmopara halstedii]CEG48864.1 small rna degrading nuclease 5-like [Plasmopara halstedii]|eukprot:XP_024585233.1 small rna degrading nuclease 5-like [Plasmopara halstedii]